MSNTHTIKFYTGNWQAALCPEPSVSVGDYVRIIEFPDGREWSDFKQTLQRDNLIIDYDDTEIIDGEEYSIYVVIKANQDLESF